MRTRRRARSSTRPTARSRCRRTSRCPCRPRRRGRVVFVLAQHARWRHDLAVDDVVGHVEQPADERLIARDDLALDRVAIARRQRLADEPALRAVRHDHGVLDLLRLHQAEHLGAEVLAPIGPANAAARDLRRAQVHGFHALRVDEDLELRPRFRQVRQRVRIELERDVRLRRAVRVALVVVRAQQRADDRAVGSKDPVVVEVLRAVDLALERVLARREPARALAPRADRRRTTPRTCRSARGNTRDNARATACMYAWL